MPSCAGTGLCLPEVGGLVLYLTLPLVWSRPSDLYELKVQPAPVASVAKLAGLGESSPPASATTAITATTAATRTAAPPICSPRLREDDRAGASSAAWRSWRRRSFSCCRDAIRPGSL